MKPGILTLLGHYLPGYKSGGPLRSVFNLVEHLGDEFDFRIVTKDRDIGDTSAYEGIPLNRWHSMGKAQVLHASPDRLGFRAMAEIMRETPHDLLYISSSLSRTFDLNPVLARRLGLVPRRPLVIAPRGVFSRGAMALKAWKKRPYIWAVRAAGLYRDALWQAGSEYEAEDIRRVMGASARVHIASDLPSLARRDLRDPATITDAPLRIVFLSRIVPMKNLEFAIECLSKIGHAVRLTVLGPREDAAYWRRCEAAIRRLPDHITVDIAAAVHPDDVPGVLATHDLFFLPSLGEGLGHVISEAMAVGTPVLISDRTPWRGLEAAGVGYDLPLGDPAPFAAKLDAMAHETAAQRAARRARVVSGYVDLAQIDRHVSDNRTLFEMALNGVPSPV